MRAIRPSSGLALILVLLATLGASAAHGAGNRNGRIVVSTSNEIASLRPDGSGYRVLVTGDVGLEPQWSPDKSKIAYHVLGDTSYDLYVMDRDGTDKTLIEDSVGPAATWSPDGAYVAFPKRTAGDDPLGHDCRALQLVDVETLAHRPLGDVPGCVAVDPRWSPDGSEIVFSGGWVAGIDDPGRDLYTVDVATGETTQLTDDDAIDRAPSWSPDGSRIVFESSRDRDRPQAGSGGCLFRTEIYVMRRAETRARRVTPIRSSFDCSPVWSPDGRRIAWTTSIRDPEGGRYHEIRVMRADGSDKLPLTDGRRLASGNADFSPDGRSIAFDGSRELRDGSFHTDLYIAAVDGSAITKLTSRGSNNWHPDW